MKKPKFPAVAAKRPKYAPTDLRKLELGTTRKNVRTTGTAAATKVAAAHRNTIVSTDNRTVTDTSLDDETSVGHVNHTDDDFDFDDMDLASSADYYQPKGHRLDSAAIADSEGWEREQEQQSTYFGPGHHAENTATTAGFDNGTEAGEIPPWDAGRFDVAQIKHVADCLGIDTVGLEFTGIEPDGLKLSKVFGEKGDDGRTVSGSEWYKGSLVSPTGKRSLVFDYVVKTKKLGIEGSNAMHRQGHNVVASGDLTMTAYSMVTSLLEAHDLGWPTSVDHQVAHGVDVEVTRIDVVLLLGVPAGVSKAEFINALAIAGLQAGVNTSFYANESVYFNQSSQVEAAKLYDKEAELRRARKGALPGLVGIEELLELNRRTVRLECVFRAKRLVQIAKAYGGRPHPRLFTKELLAEMVLTLLQKLSLQGNIFRRLEHAELLAIPLPYRSTFAHWQNGEVLIDMVKSERVLKEQKSFLKTKFKFNLNKPYPSLVREPISLAEIFAPANFTPIPDVVLSNPELFYQIDMEAERVRLKKQVGNGISSVILDPYRAPDVTITLNRKPWVI